MSGKKREKYRVVCPYLRYAGKKVVQGTIVSDIPGMSVAWLLRNGDIELVVDEGAAIVAAQAQVQVEGEEAKA